jgi:hypothetical protein
MAAHLIHIGYAKTGTTLLKAWFQAHPEIAYVRDGIAGFEGVDDLSRRCADPQFKALLRVTSSEALATPRPCANGTPDYVTAEGHVPHSRAEVVCAELASLFPTAHVLLVTRGFRSIMVSGYSQYVATGGTDGFFGARPGFGADDHSRQAWNYDGTIAHYRAAFGERLIVLPYELLRDDPERFVHLLTQRFGLSAHPLPADRRNASLTGVELRWYPVIGWLVRALPVGRTVRQRLLALYSKVVQRNLLRPLIAMLQWLCPLEPVGPSMVAPEVLERFRGKADCLRGDPLYAPYESDYLLNGAPAAPAS